jgi:hypothetical protein
MFCASLLNVDGQFDQCDRNAPYICSFESKDFQDGKTHCNWTLSNNVYPDHDGNTCHSGDACVTIVGRNGESLTSATACPTNTRERSAVPLCLAFWYYFEVTNERADNFTGFIDVTLQTKTFNQMQSLYRII